MRDLTFAIRLLRRSPGHTAIMILVLAVGIGAATTMFSIMDGVLLRRLPIADQDQVVALWLQDRLGELKHLPLDDATFSDFRDQSTAFEHLGAIDFNGAWPYVLLDGDEAVTLKGTGVTGDLFPTLGIVPALGRILLPEDDLPGAATVLVLAYNTWQRQFAGEPAILGRTLRIGQASYTVVGVMPRGFEYPLGVDFWMTYGPKRVAGERLPASVDLIGRLRPGMTAEQAAADLNSFIRRLEVAADFPPASRGLRAVVNPFPHLITGSVRPAILILSAAVVLLLLIACSNLATLLLIRHTERAAEFAVRSALGGGRWRIARQILTENIVLVLAGGAAGLLLSRWLIGLLHVMAPPELPRIGQVQLDLRAISFALAATVPVLIFLALGPTLQPTAGDLGAHLRSGSRQGSAGGRGSQRVRRVLVVAQVSLTTVVLIGAGLLVRTVAELQRVDLGFDGEQLIFAQLLIPSGTTPDRTARLALLDRIATGIRAVPGVAGATPVLAAPFSGKGDEARYAAAGQSAEVEANNPWIHLELVAPDYFETLRIPIHRGRGFSEYDREGTLPVVVVNEALANLTWPGEDAVGKEIKAGGSAAPGPWYRVVGVAADTRYRGLTDAGPGLYMLHRQAQGYPPTWIALRLQADAATVIPAVRRALGEVYPNLRIVRVASIPETISAPLARPRSQMALMSAFAVVAFGLAMLGIYGLVAAFVRARRREIGVRIALGASPASIRRHVIWQGFSSALLGTILGAMLAFAGTRTLSALLFQVSPIDPWTFGATICLMSIVALLASYLPARLAARTEPQLLLRGE